MYRGSMVALVTPMQTNGEIDFHCLQELVEWHIESKTTAIIAAGTTGESATLDPDEQNAVISAVVKAVNKRIPVIAGTGANSTRLSIQLTQNAKNAGADACLIVTPYYNKPPQAGLYEHYQAIAAHTDIPIILYNVPSRTSCDLMPETIEKLAKIERIIGVKEATGEIERAREIIDRCGSQFEIYSGHDATGLDLMLAGAHGVISVTANVAPQAMYRMCEAVATGNHVAAKEYNDQLMPLHQKLFLESNPIPTKWALHQMGKIPAGIRLPLLPLAKQYEESLKEALERAGVLENVGI